MSNPIDIISALRRKGATISVENGKLLCQAPKGVIDEEARRLISENKPEIIILLETEGTLDLVKLPIRPAKIPMSYAQERLWFLAELGQSDQYHIPGFMKIGAKLDLDVITKGFQSLVDRHESLRTCFRKENGEGYQLVLDQVKVLVQYEDFKGVDINNPELQSTVNLFANTHFDLENGPLLRVLVIETSDDSFILGYCIHHIISDGWSITILQREVNEYFNAIALNRPAKLPEIKVQFADYAIWQRKVLSLEKLKEKIAHWKNHLDGHQDITIPVDFDRPDELSGRGDNDSLTLNAAKSDWIRNYCKSQNITIFSFMLAIVYGLLNRYCNQNDICVGIPIANRNHKDIEGLIGFFANTVVNRIKINSETSLEQLVLNSQKELLRSQDYQDVPFSKVVDAVQPPRDASKTPIFQILVNYVNFANQPISIKSKKSKDVIFKYSTSKFDLNFTFAGGSDGPLELTVEYSTDLFMPETITRILKHYDILIENFIRDATQLLSKVNLETSPEKLTIDKFNHTRVSDWKPKLLSDKFLSEKLLLHPEKVAVRDENGVLTYSELVHKSNELAIKLLDKGVGTNKLVGICLDRSREMVVAIIAVLKAGCAYVPLDPLYPNERLNHMLTDSKIKILVSDNNYADNHTFSSVQSILKIEDLSGINQGITSLENIEIKPEDGAYVIYTSGSTGKPKGVLQTHETISNLTDFQKNEWGIELGSNKEVSQFASSSFDVSVQEIFFSLLNELTLNVVSQHIKISAEDMVHFVAEKEINFLFLPTAYLNLFANEAIDQQQMFRNLEHVIVAGETLKITNTIRTFFSERKNVRLNNHYGPSETHVATAILMDNNPETWNYIPTIGKPISNLRTFILNESKVKAPLGGLGELYISGSGLAKGYINNEQLTADKFVDNPHGIEQLYKTGDLGRWLPSGEIEFYGRLDEQVKIRGYRVELGEVEKAILEHPSVEAATVITKDLNGSKQLVGFYTALMSIQAVEIKQLLQKILPDYMEPAGLKQIPEIPLTHNGKVDRNKLLAIEIELKSNHSFRAPKTEIEKSLAEVWSELLGVKRVGLDDNFFELGGHSLLAVKMVSTINKKVPDANLKVMDVLKFPTLVGMSSYLGLEDKVDTGSPFILQFKERTANFIIPGMPGLSDGYLDMGGMLDNGTGGTYGLTMKGFGVESSGETIAEMAAHNLELISEIMPYGKINLYAHSFGGTVSYEMLKQYDAGKYEIDQVVFLDSTPHQKVEKLTLENGVAIAQNILMNYMVEDRAIYLEVFEIFTENSNKAWKELLNKFLGEKIAGFDTDFFGKLWDMFEKSLIIDYKFDGLLDFKVDLVIANESIGNIKEDVWSEYFKGVDVTYSPGNHFTMVKKEYCGDWIKRLKNKP